MHALRCLPTSLPGRGGGGGMSQPVGNPKLEGRRPKEARNPKAEGRKKLEIPKPKSECDFSVPGVSMISKSGWLRKEQSTEALLLREDSSTPLQPLGERTGQFGEAIVLFAKRIP